MTTYEEQCSKWARKRYPEVTGWAYATVEFETNVMDGCPTCGPEREDEVSIYFRDENGKTVTARYFTLDWQEGFSRILKEIIEA